MLSFGLMYLSNCSSSFKDKNFYKFLCIVIGYTFIFTGIAIWRYENFLIHGSNDLLLFEQFIYNTLHGRPFYATGIENAFAYHNSPILFILVPIAAIIPVPYVLYASTALSIAVSAVPIYLISGEELKNEKLALFLGTCYMMLPGLVGQVYQSFHEINLVLPFLTFSFYYFVRKRFYPFLIMLALGLMVKEDVSVTFFMFSIYAIIKRRDMKWIVFPAIISATWLLISIKVIIPFFNKGHSYPMISYFSDMGDSFSEIIANTISHPQDIFYKLFLPDKIEYLYILFLPIGFVLPFMSIEILFAMPYLFLNLLVESSRFRLVEVYMSYGVVPIPRHMSLIAIVFLFISSLYSLKKIGLLHTKHALMARLVLSLSLAIGVVYSDRFIVLGENLYRLPSYVASRESIETILSHIPINATVKADRWIATHLYNRKEVYASGGMTDADYIVVTERLFVYKAKQDKFGLSSNDNEVKTDDILVYDSNKNPVNVGIKERYDLVVLGKGIAIFKKSDFVNKYSR